MTEPNRRFSRLDRSVSPVESESRVNITRQRGRMFLVALYAAARNLKLYPAANQQVQTALEELQEAALALLSDNLEIEIRYTGEILFVDATRLRIDADTYAPFSWLLNTLRLAEVGTVLVAREIQTTEWSPFLNALSTAAAAPARECYVVFERAIATGRMVHISVTARADNDEDDFAKREAAKRTYARSVTVTRQLFERVRTGGTVVSPNVKRSVQAIIDEVLNDDVSLIGLSTMRDYDEYTFRHSVNVCILCILMGKRLGLSRRQLYDLGMAALLYDVGKSRISHDLLNKRTPLTRAERSVMEAHSWLGVLTLFDLRDFADLPYRAMVVAFEHHLDSQLAGYPAVSRPRTLSLYSQIVAVADAYDAATNLRPYRGRPLRPDQALREIIESDRFEPGPVKALVNLLSIFPVGTCVLLDTFELAIVHAPGHSEYDLARPIVRVISSVDGTILADGPLVALTEQRFDGSFRRSIMRVTDPAKYGVEPADYFL